MPPTEGVRRRNHGYDQYGNNWVSLNENLPLSASTPVAQSWFNAANNQIVGYAYEPSGTGNLTGANGWTYAYDGENRLKQAQTTINGTTYTNTYQYDGEGRRVKKTVGTVNTVYVYDAMGQMIAEYTDASTEQTAATEYVLADHLGSTRAVLDALTNTLSCHDYLPFGEELTAGRESVTCYNNPDSVKQKFTGKERDSETGLDYFGARYFFTSVERFTTADSMLQSKLRLLNPQGWNAYAYVLNNPLKMIDPDGREAKIVIVNISSYDAKTVNAAANQLRSFAKDAGLKNVSVKVTSSAPGATLKSMVDKHTAVINVTDTSVGTLGQMGFRNPLGNVPGQANAVNISKNAIDAATLPASDPAGNPARALGNVMSHEFVHTSQGVLGGHSDDPTNIMYDGMNPDFGGTLNDEQKKQLQDQYNRPNELDKDKIEPQKIEERKKGKQ